MTRRKRLTDAGIERLRPSRKEYTVWDTQVAGLGVRVRPSGYRSYVWQGHVSGAAVRVTIGSAALGTVDEARRKSLEVRNGSGPSDPEDGKGLSSIPLFGDFALSEWKPAFGQRWGLSRLRYVERTLDKRILPAFGALRLDTIRRADVERWFDADSRTAPGAANMALSLLRQILQVAVATGHIASNPTQGIKRNPRPKLSRFLSTDEIDRLHGVLDRLVGERPSRRVQADIIRLLLLTGCRRGEILNLKWAEVDGDVLRLTETKTGPRRVWLSEAARAIIARQPRTGGAYVFPSPKDPARPCSKTLALWQRARTEAGLDDVRLHDLRHTVASQAVARGVALPTVARMLGHADPAMTLRYAHAGDREVEAASERIGRVIDAAMARK